MSPAALPEPLRAFLRDNEHAMLTIGTNIGAVLLVKAPSRDIESCRGRRAMQLDYELHENEYGPLLRLVLSVPDERLGTLLLETFCNLADPDQLREWRELLSGAPIKLAFYDEHLVHRLSKVVGPATEAARALLERAVAMLEATPPVARNFDRAKLLVMAENPLDAPRER